MSDYISKSEAIDRLSEVLSSEAEFENAKQVIIEAPTLDEKEIIRKAFERVVKRLEELKNDCDCYGHLKKKGLVDWAIEIVKEECGINE